MLIHTFNQCIRQEYLCQFNFDVVVEICVKIYSPLKKVKTQKTKILHVENFPFW